SLLTKTTLLLLPNAPSLFEMVSSNQTGLIKKPVMRYKEVAFSSFKSLRNNPVRTGLTMLGIIIGISAVILISSLGQGAVAFITNELSVFGSSNFRIAPGQNSFTQVAQ